MDNVANVALDTDQAMHLFIVGLLVVSFALGYIGGNQR